MSASSPAPQSEPSPAANPASVAADRRARAGAQPLRAVPRASAHFAAGPGFAACRPWWWRCLFSPLSCSRCSFPLKAWSARCWWAIFCSSTSRPTRPPSRLGRWLLPYRSPARGDIVVFRHPDPPMLIKRVVGVPGDRLRIAGGQVFINGVALNEPYAAFEPAPPDPGRDNFPGEIYTPRLVDPEWWRQMQSLTSDGELDRARRASTSSWATTAITAGTRATGDLCRARPSSAARWSSISRSIRPSPTDVEQPPQAASAARPDDRLGHERELAAKVAAFARWRRIFHVVH